MLTLNDGRKELYQWDTGRTATVDIYCDVVHFANLKYGESLAVEVKEGKVAIPNKLLMSGEPIYCWAFVKDEGGAYTKKEQTFVVAKRAKPSDYVYTETETLTWKSLDERITELEKGGTGGSGISIDDTLTIPGAAADAKAAGDQIRALSDEIADTAEIDEDGIVSFKNSDGKVLFTLDLSDFSRATYGEMQLSAVDVSITEGGSGVFTVKLATAPSGTQTVYLAVSDNTKVSVRPATLTFTKDNFEIEQTVTVTALEDTDDFDESVSVSLTSKKVEAKVVMITIADNDKAYEVITDGLALYVDYRNHTDDTSDTITDSASGLTFNGFSQFNKVDNGIYGKGQYTYLTVAKDDAHTAFVEKMKSGNGFTIEAFGTQIPTSFFLPNYRGMIGTGSDNGYTIQNMILVENITNPTRNLADGTNDYSKLSGDCNITIEGETFDLAIKSNQSKLPELDVFVHIVKTYSPDGTIASWINGYKFDNDIVIENFASWDYDGMFANFSLRNNNQGNENRYTSSQRIYNRVLAEDEIRNNMEAEKSKMILTAF